MRKNNFEDGVIGPLQVPAKHDPKASLQERAVFALADLGKGTAKQVTAKLAALGDGDADETRVKKILEALFNKGLVNGSDNDGNRTYNLAKETRPHRGRVDTDPPMPS
ncbi:hypothetical protein [Parapedobacter indicus]|uniref:Uncharacterized protein n=1 Tax=Parapedobacter indicus TaxID=1477437 RepID=A0A1I3UG53_9SPHI|nr:hypothetical protein [Parapedobacter indicus]PPK99249.1 hypothetical protein CLV26_114100 [Parapedobacter indicus]SFJ80846.1 hypothetical protein SAMN05444682_114100 [Parapedobacter indicus]